MSRMPPCQVEGRARQCKTPQACGRSGSIVDSVAFSGTYQACRSPNRCPATLRGFLPVWRKLSVSDCRLIRRPAKDARRRREACLYPVTRKNVWSSEKYLVSLRCHRITMVQPAEPRKGLNLVFARRASFCRPTCWRVLRESQMSPVLVIIEQVRRHQPFQMPLIQDDHVVQQVASATSHPVLRNTVLPRTAKGRSSWLASHIPHSRNHLGSKLCVAVE
jgi:hypothetical protein